MEVAICSIRLALTVCVTAAAQAAEGLALLAEQNATWALSLAKRAVILDLGRMA